MPRNNTTSLRLIAVGLAMASTGIVAVPALSQGRPASIAPGNYECYAYTGGRLSPRGGLNFAILSGGIYRDVTNVAGTYSFDASSGGILFSGAALGGQRASYKQPSTPPAKRAPPAITFAVSGDACDLQM